MSDWFDGAGNGSAVDVAKILDSGAPEVLWDIVSRGAMISVGTTSDGGALGVTVTLDGRWRREYFRDSADLVDWLCQAREAIAAAPPRPDASSARRQRQRGR